MPQPVRFAFSGDFDLSISREFVELQQRLLGQLREESAEIAREIGDRISDSIGVHASRPEVEIHFVEGSIHWAGIVQWAHDAWQVAKVMSTVGGSLGLIQIVRESVDGVLRRRFSRVLRSALPPFFIASRILIIEGLGERETKPRLQDSIFGIAALIASLAAFIAALGLFIHLVR